MNTLRHNEVPEPIFTDLDVNFEDIKNWRRYLHQHPELSFEEVHPAKFIEEKLVSFGLEVQTQIGGNGLIGVIKREPARKDYSFASRL
jgi:amidohydrolase